MGEKILHYLAPERVGREGVTVKATALMCAGNHIFSIKHKMVPWTDCDTDGWGQSSLIRGYEITVDAEGARQYRLPEIVDELAEEAEPSDAADVVAPGSRPESVVGTPGQWPCGRRDFSDENVVAELRGNPT